MTRLIVRQAFYASCVCAFLAVWGFAEWLAQ